MSHGDIAGGPGRIAYLALLGTTTLGTLSSTIISAPINDIANDLGATASQILFAVSAFTVAMVVFAPLAGWLCERYGAKLFLLASLGLMTVAQLGAALSPDLGVLVLMRSLQGVACSAIPPVVQHALGTFWAARRGRVMATWASAIGVGQAIGPPLGGLVADATGWRSIFVVHAVLTVALALVLARFVPHMRPRRPPMHVAGMAALIGGVGSLVVAFTWAGQGGPLVLEIALVLFGLGLLALYHQLSRRSRQALVDPRLLVEARYLRSTVAAATVMASLGVVIVTVPLYLGRDLDLRPSVIGAITFALAAAMALFAPISSRIAERLTPRRVLHIGLVTLVVGPLLLASASTVKGMGSPGWILAILLIIGCGIGAVQSSAAFGVMRSPAAERGSALGIHNMMRFAGLALGYAWVAATYPLGSLFLVYSGPAMLAAAAFLLTFIGPPAAPIQEPAPGDTSLR